MPTPTYDALVNRVKELRERFVDFDIPIDRDPTSHELDMIASFKLLIHAEIETFIEERIRQTVEDSIKVWKADKRVPRSLLNLVVKWYPWFERDRNPYARPQYHGDFSELFNGAAARAAREINENNGIKKENFSNLCYSSGLLLDDLPPTLFASLDSYGSGRGDVAHKAVGKVRTLNDPRVEGQNAEQLVILLESFDTSLSAVAAP